VVTIKWGYCTVEASMSAPLAACSEEQQVHERNITSNVVIDTPSAQNAE
jgi:hypothetical protein